MFHPAGCNRKMKMDLIEIPQTHSILISFDWDNTLFPLKVMQDIAARRSSTPDANELAWLDALSQRVYTVLYWYVSTYSARNIVIVTASKPGWVAKTLAKLKGVGWWSAISDLIFSSEHPIAVIHPQSAELPFTSGISVIDYKQRVFRQLLDAFCPQTFVSIGDSSVEFRASKQAADNSATFCFCSRLKLAKHPSMTQMVRQIDFMITKCGGWMPESVDIVFQSPTAPVKKEI